jgi:hypothetical protein
MTGKLARSWALTKQAWSILRDDKRLLIFPIISGTLVTLLICSTLVGVIAAVSVFETPGGGAEDSFDQFVQEYGALKWPALFVLYLVTHFIITFFQAALMSCALMKMDGQRPSVRAGLKVASSRLPQIFGWSLVNATVGLALQMLQERVGFLARLFLGAASIVWNIATFFVVPVLVLEGVGPIEAVKRSTGAIKKTWGESLITQFGFSAVTSLIGLAVFLLLAGGGIGLSIATESYMPAAIMLPLAVIAIILLAIVQSAMKTLLVAATYRFASTGAAPGPFDAETLRGVFQHKRSRR